MVNKKKKVLNHVDVESRLKWTTGALCSCYISLGIAVLTFITDLSGYSIEYTLFERFGSIMVLCGAILEYQIGSAIALGDNRTEKSFRHEDVLSLDDLITKAPRIRMKAHFFVICGTLIWGFGGLLQKAVCEA